MKDKLAALDCGVFATYELLEMLLYYVIPYRDTKPVAKRLLAAFGSLDGVLLAEREELVKIDGVGERTADFIICVGELLEVSAMPDLLSEIQPLDKYETVGSLLVDALGTESEPAVYALLLDNSMRPLALERVVSGDLSSSEVRSKPFIDLALRHRASVIITAHTHPHGPLFATPADVATQSLLECELGMVGVLVAEHYVICGNQYIGTKDNVARGVDKLPRLADFSSAGRGVRTAGTVKLGTGIGSDTLSIKLSAPLGFFIRGEKLDTELAPLSAGHTLLMLLFAPLRTLYGIFGEKSGIPLFLRLLAGLASRRATDKLTGGVMAEEELLREYLIGLFFGKSVEAMYLIAFDKDGRFIASECIGEGSVNAFSADPRRILELATELGAAVVAVAHNHPRGVPEPSAEDKRATTDIMMLLGTVGIELRAHYIVSDNRCAAINLTDFSDMRDNFGLHFRAHNPQKDN